MPLDAERVLLHVRAAATVAPVPLATGSWWALLKEWPLTGSPFMVPCDSDVRQCEWGGAGWSGRGRAE